MDQLFQTLRAKCMGDSEDSSTLENFVKRPEGHEMALQAVLADKLNDEQVFFGSSQRFTAAKSDRKIK